MFKIGHIFGTFWIVFSLVSLVNSQYKLKCSQLSSNKFNQCNIKETEIKINSTLSDIDVGWRQPQSINHVFVRFLKSEYFPEYLESILEILKSLKNLEVRSCGRIAILSQSFKNSKHLETILMVGNNMTFLRDYSFLGADNLRVLDLHDNGIEMISPNAFHGLKKVENISLDLNDIWKLDFLLFKILTNLKSLSLSGNKIIQISNFDKKSYPDLSSLDLTGNSCINKKFRVTVVQDLTENFARCNPSFSEFQKRIVELNQENSRLSRSLSIALTFLAILVILIIAVGVTIGYFYFRSQYNTQNPVNVSECKKKFEGMQS
jgi:hypothetical protein